MLNITPVKMNLPSFESKKDINKTSENKVKQQNSVKDASESKKNVAKPFIIGGSIILTPLALYGAHKLYNYVKWFAILDWIKSNKEEQLIANSFKKKGVALKDGLLVSQKDGSLFSGKIKHQTVPLTFEHETQTYKNGIIKSKIEYDNFNRATKAEFFNGDNKYIIYSPTWNSFKEELCYGNKSKEFGNPLDKGQKFSLEKQGQDWLDNPDKYYEKFQKAIHHDKVKARKRKIENFFMYIPRKIKKALSHKPTEEEIKVALEKCLKS